MSDDKIPFSMEMMSVGTEVYDDGRMKPIYVVKFTSRGETFTYPWNHLKKTVVEWMKIEGEEC